MRKKDLEKIKEQIKKERREKKKFTDIEPDIIFSNKASAALMERDLHITTIYKLIKVPHIDQMLDTMYESTIKEYKLHTPTVERMLTTERVEIEALIEKKIGKKVKIHI